MMKLGVELALGSDRWQQDKNLLPFFFVLADSENGFQREKLLALGHHGCIYMCTLLVVGDEPEER
ncbi:ARM family protein [Desulfovibrio ferrophilus]|uniref:ARM family protein n=1 Tax=Desulfovibrio ferrophilus TaxID=241368 RepID=A0A2Z6B2X8_9BACT|nr:ARM family protein [Desulfovibrio ferrophilus]